MYLIIYFKERLGNSIELDFSTGKHADHYTIATMNFTFALEQALEFTHSYVGDFSLIPAL